MSKKVAEPSYEVDGLFAPYGTSASGVDWEVDETCTRLIEEATTEPLIVVGLGLPGYHCPLWRGDEVACGYGQPGCEWGLHLQWRG